VATRATRAIIVRSVLAAGVLAVAAVGSLLLALQAESRSRAAYALEEDAAVVMQGQRLAGDLQSGLVGLGVGPPRPTTEDEVRSRVSQLSGAAIPPVGDAELVRIADRADQARNAYLESAGRALDEADDVDEVARRLPALSEEYDALVDTWSTLERRLQAAGAESADSSARLRTSALVLLLLGTSASALVLWSLRRVSAYWVDRPVDRLRRAVAQMAGGEAVTPTGIEGSTDLAALGREVDEAAAAVDDRLQRLFQQAAWGAQSRMIFEALDLVENEAEAHEVAQQALELIDRERSFELLLAPHGSTGLSAVAATDNPDLSRPACPVDVTTSCVAVRRAQPVVFDSSESINACPKLRHRPYGPCSAACVPVSIAGRPVGVLHTVAPDRHPPDDRTVTQMATLSTQLGNRLGALRALESSRAEAATDKLTGLPNRRMLESQIGSLIERGTPFVLVLADLDKFKRLNDTYGHEVGDRALQTFAQVLRDKVRGNDVIARLGGEEFVLVYPNMSVTTSIEAIERIRDGLTQALAVSALPEFTCSFGITHSAVARSGEAIIRVADAGLLRAKELGGDQVVYADESLAAQMFGEEGRP
jgi:diguanylate cyclase (GGDEF)-like protein